WFSSADWAARKKKEPARLACLATNVFQNHNNQRGIIRKSISGCQWRKLLAAVVFCFSKRNKKGPASLFRQTIQPATPRQTERPSSQTRQPGLCRTSRNGCGIKLENLIV
ncbi:MAG TPA: hypothetical protein VGB07_06245, partial [Blastocatellia bacterium]